MPPTSIDLTRPGGAVITERDLTVLTWIGEQRAVTLEQIAVLLSRHRNGPAPGAEQAASPQKDPDRLTRGRARKRVAAWRQHGLCVQRRIVTHHDTLVWLTQDGLDSMGLPFKSRPHGPVLQHLTHTLTVAAVRLHAEAYPGWRWICEAELEQDYGISRKFSNAARSHLPDGLLISSDGQRGAVEVELSVKHDAALDTILFDLTDDDPGYRPPHDRVVYYVTDQTRRPVERAVTRLEPARAAKVTIHDLPTDLVTDPAGDR